MQSFPETTLAIDYGTRRIGLAVSQAALVEPLEVIHWDGADEERVIAKVIEIVVDLQVKEIVVGVSEGDMAQRSIAFGERLAQASKLPVSYADETLTSQVVEQKIRALKKKKRSEAIDSFAAAEILEGYLEG